MENYSIVIFLLALMIGLTAIASKIRIPYPILLVSTGIIIGFIPGMPEIEINPEIIFLIFLPPLLFDAAFNISIPELRNNMATVSTLAIPLVFLTTTAVAVVVHYMLPDMSWPLSFLLGAIVSPPDAVAATSVTKGLGLSQRTLTILEGESLINDASALVAYRFAVATIAGASFTIWTAPVQFIIVLLGGIVIGITFAKIAALFLKKVHANSLTSISAMTLSPFITYLLAEEMHVSGVIAVVVMGLTLSGFTGKLFSEGTKIQNKSFWDVIIFLLNGLVFILIGLEFPHVVKHMSDEMILLPLIGYGFLITFLMLVIRIIWIRGHNNNIRKEIVKRQKKSGKPSFWSYSIEMLDWKEALIIGWSGMRGIVSLAAALALPIVLSDGSAFPQRDTIICLSVIVVLITLVVQGLSLPLLVHLLKIDKPQLIHPQ
ncbi:MAG: Na+/H+ antiporter [Cytophagales bacterium]|nr:Na+/H+ antiporter [Cytophaga sp.]